MRDIAVKCINDFCDVTSSKRIFKADYLPEGVPFYRAKEISEKHNGRELSDRLFISREKFETFRKKFGVPQDGDLLLTSIGALLGEPYVVSNDGDFYFKDGNLTWFRNFRGLNSKYLYYWLISPQGKAQLSTAVIGSAQPAFTIVALKNMSIKVPSISYQSKVVAILSAYDDLIENNTRRIAILEEMAQAIYREWFVNFRFPGHENVKLVDSSLGKIPEGWEAVRVESLLKRLKASRQYKQDDVANEGTVPVIDQSTSELLGFHDNEPDFEASPIAPVVIFGDHTCKMELITTPFSIGPNVVPFVSKTEHPVGFVFYLVKSLVSTQEYKRHWTTLNNKEICLSPAAVANAFVEVISPMVEAVALLRKKNRNLRTTRDLLLPKLISGQLDVEDLDIDVSMTAEELTEAAAG